MSAPETDLKPERLSRLTLRQLEYFRAIAQAGSIAAAAEALLISRSTVAAALTDLERVLGVQLFTRHKARGVELTATGAQLRDRAVSLLTLAYGIELELNGKSTAGPFSFGCYGSLAPTVLPGLLTLMRERYPNAAPTFVVSTEDVLLEKLWSGETEFVVSYDLQSDQSLSTVLLYRTRMHVILSGDHPLAQHTVVNVQDLSDEPLILVETPPSADDILGYLTREGLAPNIRHRTVHFELARSLVGAGLGYALFVQVPQSGVSYQGQPVIVKPLSPAPPVKSAVIAWPKGRELSAAARAFIDLAVENVELYEPERVYPELALKPDPAGSEDQV